MDGRGFFLGLIAAVVLFLLWKKESGSGMNFSFAGLVPQGDSSGTGGCAGCSTGIGYPALGSGPGYSASPAAQSMIAANGTAGQITPGTPPLQSVAGTGSFYATAGPTPDSSFTNIPAAKPVSVVSTVARTQTTVHNVPGSPSTPATIVPTRAVGVVPPYPLQGFQQRYNVTGVARNNLRMPTRMLQ
jgi:hypothetical protein